MNRYAQRDSVLRQMGYDYLASPLWASIRRRIFRVCDICPCGDRATEIHHRTYKRRYLEGRGKIHQFLVPVCRSCHQRIEVDDGGKTPLGKANRLLDEITMVGLDHGVVRPRKCWLKPERQERHRRKHAARPSPAANSQRKAMRDGDD